MNHPRTFWLLFAALGLPACLTADDVDDVALGTTAEDLLGATSYAGTCDPATFPMVDKAMRFGRVVVASRAYGQCVDRAARVSITRLDGGVSGPYRACRGPAEDPIWSAPLDVQITEALRRARSPRAVAMTCDPTPGASGGRAYLGYDPSAPVSFIWGLDYLRKLQTEIDEVTAWPYGELAQTAWHEGMHQNGYLHGADNQTEAPAACGYGDDPSWDFVVNTMPNIAGGCVSEVLARSQQRCPGQLQTCSRGALMIVDAFDATTCSCVDDPQAMTGLGLVGFRDGGLDVLEQVPADSAMGWWYHRATDQLTPVGDVDGDGQEDLWIEGPDSVALVSQRFGRRLAPYTLHGRGSMIGGWQVNAGDRVQRVGDLDGDGRAEILVRSGWGIGVLSYKNGQLLSINQFPWGTWRGSWFLGAADTFPLAGDLDGDGRSEILVRSGWGLGVMNLVGADLRVWRWVQHGTSAGGWWLGAGDRLDGLGAFDDRAGLELVVRSGWGLGLLGLSPSGFYVASAMPYGSSLGGFIIRDSDAVQGTGDLDRDGRADLVLRNATGLGAVGLDAGGAWKRAAAASFGEDLGGWPLTSSDRVVLVGDVDGGGGGAELVVQGPRGLTLLGSQGDGRLRVQAQVKPSGLLESWRVALADRVTGSGDFDGDGRTDLLLRR